SGDRHARAGPHGPALDPPLDRHRRHPVVGAASAYRRCAHDRNQRSSPSQPAFRQATTSSVPSTIITGFAPSTPASTKFALRNTPPKAAKPVSRPTSSAMPTPSSPSATRVANSPAFGTTTASRKSAYQTGVFGDAIAH